MGELDGNVNLRASLPSEIPNRFLLWGIYALPWKMQASPQVKYRKGFPYQPTNVFQQYVESTPGPQFVGGSQVLPCSLSVSRITLIGNWR